MKRIIATTIGLILCWSVADAAPPTALKTDASATQERSVNTELGVQNANNIAFYKQLATKWESGREFTADNNMVVHGGKVYVCTSLHTSSLTTEPGQGVSWDTVWEPHERFTQAYIDAIAAKQDTLVSGTNIKTVNGVTLLGSGDIIIEGGGDVEEAPNDTKAYARSGETWVEIPGGGDMVAANNLSEVTPAAARTNLQVYSMTDSDERYSLSAHTHSEYADAIHQHAIANITDLDNQLSAKAGISEVLSKVNTVAYTPTLPYHPATVQYVDDNVFDGAYSSLSGTPPLGTAAATDATAYATALQGATADTAVQPGDVQTITPVAPINYTSGVLSISTSGATEGHVIKNVGGVAGWAEDTGGSSTAAETSVADTGDNFTGTDVETVLAELDATDAAQDIQIASLIALMVAEGIDIPPSPPTMVISGAGPQIATFTYPEAVTATTTPDLCDDWTISMTDAGALSLGYSYGDTTTSVVCTVDADVYDDDTVTSASYTQGTIQANDDNVLMANIADFSSSITNSSTEVEPVSASCTGDKVLDWPMESATITAGGCSAGDTTATLNGSASLVSTPVPAGGTYSLASTASSYASLDISSGDLFDDDAGQVEFDLYVTTAANLGRVFRFYTDSQNYVELVTLSAGTLRLYHEGQDTRVYTTTNSAVTTGSWVHIVCTWDTTTDTIDINVGGSSNNSTSGSDLVSFASALPSTVDIGATDSATQEIYIDNFVIYKAIQ